MNNRHVPAIGEGGRGKYFQSEIPPVSLTLPTEKDMATNETPQSNDALIEEMKTIMKKVNLYDTDVQNVLLRLLKRNLEPQIDQIELVILGTPTSERRNRMSDVNIHLQAAIAILKELIA